jgi:hypothetical protein
LLALVFPRVAWRWHVTNTSADKRTSAVINWAALLPILCLAALTALGLLANWTGAVGYVPAADITLGNLAWSIGCLFTLGVSALACVDQPWDPENDHPDKEAQRFHFWSALLGLARRLIA